MASPTSSRPYALHPDRGIGPVWIGERKTRVEWALSHRTPGCGADCLRRYHTRGGRLWVEYDHGRASVIEARSGQITLDGIPLRRGPSRLRRALKGWWHFMCEGMRFFVHRHRPAAAVSFGAHGTIDIQVSAQGIGGCGAP